VFVVALLQLAEDVAAAGSDPLIQVALALQVNMHTSSDVCCISMPNAQLRSPRMQCAAAGISTPYATRYLDMTDDDAANMHAALRSCDI
jgi:hypothetical protein